VNANIHLALDSVVVPVVLVSSASKTEYHVKGNRNSGCMLVQHKLLGDNVKKLEYSRFFDACK
jgi:hypothetical protein